MPTVVRKYVIDYGWSTATMWSPISPDKAMERFCELAMQCFGIHRSIENPRIMSVMSVTEEPLPEPWARLQGAYEVLIHTPPIEDVIVWDADGNKIKSEWD